MVRMESTTLGINVSWENMRTDTLVRIEDDSCKRELKERKRERQRQGRMLNYSRDNFGVRSVGVCTHECVC